MTSTSDTVGERGPAADEVGAAAQLLATLPLFIGLPVDELEGLARVMRTVDFPAGSVLWRKGDEADGLHVIASGRVHVATLLPGNREVEVATLGFGEILGEIPLLGGGERMASVRAIENTRVLFLGRVEFAALLSRINPSALTIWRRIMELACRRLRARHEALVASLGGAPRQEAQPAGTSADDGSASALQEEYLRRLPFFRSFDQGSLREVLRRASVTSVPSGRVVLPEGEQPSACWITLNGAVEELINRDGRAVRVRLAGPGLAFGYVGLIDGKPSSVTAATRERSRLLLLGAADFAALFARTALGSEAFCEALQRDLMAAHRAIERPQAQLAKKP